MGLLVCIDPDSTLWFRFWESPAPRVSTHSDLINSPKVFSFQLPVSRCGPYTHHVDSAIPPLRLPSFPCWDVVLSGLYNPSSSALSPATQPKTFLSLKLFIPWSPVTAVYCLAMI